MEVAQSKGCFLGTKCRAMGTRKGLNCHGMLARRCNGAEGRIYWKVVDFLKYLKNISNKCSDSARVLLVNFRTVKTSARSQAGSLGKLLWISGSDFVEKCLSQSFPRPIQHAREKVLYYLYRRMRWLKIAFTTNSRWVGNQTEPLVETDHFNGMIGLDSFHCQLNRPDIDPAFAKTRPLGMGAAGPAPDVKEESDLRFHGKQNSMLSLIADSPHCWQAVQGPTANIKWRAALGCWSKRKTVIIIDWQPQKGNIGLQKIPSGIHNKERKVIALIWK